jgi:hypothetical protein
MIDLVYSLLVIALFLTGYALAALCRRLIAG